MPYTPDINRMQMMEYANAPSEIQTGASDIFNRIEMAKMLRDKSVMADTGTQYTKSGSGQWAAPPQAIQKSIFESALPLAQAGAGAYMQNSANEDNLALAQKLKDYNTGEVDKYMTAKNGTPAQPADDTGQYYGAGNNPDEESGQGFKPAQAAVAPDDAKALAIALNSNQPFLNTLGQHQLTSQVDQQNTLNLMNGIMGKGQPTQGGAAPVGATALSPATDMATPTGVPMTPQDKQTMVQDMLKRGDTAGIAALNGAAPATEPTPLDKFAQTTGVTQEQAQKMVMSGNKGLMAAGNKILQGYQQASIETLIKQPGRQQLATQSQDAAASRQQTGIAAASARQERGITAASDRQQQSFAQKLANASLSPDAVDNAAENYRITGNLPPMGMGGMAEKAKIMNRAAEQAKEHGTSAEALSLGMMAGKANSAALNQLTKQEQSVMAYEKTANMGADLALKLAGDVSTTGVPVVTGWIQAGQKAVEGDPAISKFHAANETFINEYAKIMSGSMGNTPISDAARAHAHSLLSTAMNPDQYAGVIGVLKQDMSYRKKGFVDQKAELMRSMNNAGPAAPTTPTPASGGTLSTQEQAELDALRKKFVRGSGNE